jgi:hypothetical protein
MQRLPPEFAVLDQEHVLVEPFATCRSLNPVWAMAITYIRCLSRDDLPAGDLNLAQKIALENVETRAWPSQTAAPRLCGAKSNLLSLRDQSLRPCGQDQPALTDRRSPMR